MQTLPPDEKRSFIRQLLAPITIKDKAPVDSPAPPAPPTTTIQRNSPDDVETVALALKTTMPEDSSPTLPVPASPVGSERVSTWAMLNKTRTDSSIKAWGSFVKKNVPHLLHYGEKHKVAQISPEVWGKAEDWYVLGDLHGDFYALSNCVRYLLDQKEPFKLILLGDLVDRGPHPVECLWLILHLAAERPHSVLWLAGNHDVGIFEQTDTSFNSSVSPAEFVDELNKVDSWTPFRREFGREYIELVNGLPRAALSPDGTLFTHGGFPLVDLHKDLADRQTREEKLDWLNSEQALQDFTWTRITRYLKKIPNRSSTGCSYGYGDFAAFSEAVGDFFPANRLVTGHEHPIGGVDEHPAWKTHRALTLNGFAFDANKYEYPVAFTTGYQEQLVLGRCRNNDIPEIIRIPVVKSDLQEFFDKELAFRFPESWRH